MELKFYICKHCGKIVAAVKDTPVPIMCCGEKMAELVPGTTDAAVEKHVPAVETNDGIVTVKVGSVAHPMIPEHYIQWVVIKTEQGVQGKALTPDSAPEAEFALLPGDRAVEAYAYCNLHGLWKVEIS